MAYGTRSTMRCGPGHGLLVLWAFFLSQVVPLLTGSVAMSTVCVSPLAGRYRHVENPINGGGFVPANKGCMWRGDHTYTFTNEIEV